MSLLRVENATRAFGSLVAVNDVSLSVAPGELQAVIGPNGAGKTTFFNLISGFFPPTSGKDLLRRQGRDRVSHRTSGCRWAWRARSRSPRSSRS